MTACTVLATKMCSPYDTDFWSRFLVLQEHLVMLSKTNVSIALCLVRILGDAVSSKRFEIQIKQIENGTELGRRLIRIME